jgi:hypothetical protein
LPSREDAEVPMTTSDWIEIVAGVAIVFALTNRQIRLRRNRPDRVALTSGAISYSERVLVKFMTSIGWSGRISRGMRLVVRQGSVSVVHATELLGSILGSERHWGTSDLTMSVSSRPSRGYPRRTWVVLTPVNGDMPIAVTSKAGQNERLVTELEVAGVQLLAAPD